MQRRLILAAALIVLMFMGINNSRADEQHYQLSQLQWLTGCWIDEKPGHLREENWTRPAAGMMMGTGRLINNDRIVEFEFMRIHQEKEGIFFTAKPSNQPEASFKLIKMSSNEAVFENPQHDFPQRVIYRHLADGRIAVRIEGEVKGKARGIDFPFQRGKC